MKFKKKKLLCLLLCMTMVLATVVNPTVASAADEDVKYVSYDNVAETYRGDEITYPQDQAGYVFAGWYSKSGEEYLPMSETTADQASTAYGKFVKSNVLGLKFQVTAGTTALSESTSIRVLTAVDDLYYQEVGFEATGDMTENYTSTTVYSKITAGGKTYEADEVFGVPAEYFMTFTGTLPQANFANNLTFRPMWVTLDGTTVYGAAKSVKVNDNVPDGTFKILDFENLEDVHNVAGTEDVATLSRGAYGTDITADAAVYGDYALKAVPSDYYPTFTVDLGRTYDVDVDLYVSAYVAIDPAYIKSNYVHIDQGGTQWSYGTFNTWLEFRLPVPAGSSEHSFRFNFAMGPRVSDVTKMVIYFDNVELSASVTTLDFESSSDAEYVAGNNQVASLSRVAYADTDITADAATYGNYALKAVPSNKWPVFTIDLGRTYDVDVDLYISVYAAIDEDYINKDYLYIDQGGTQWSYGTFNKWQEFRLPVPAGSSEHSFRFNFDGRVSDVTKMVIYFDNIQLEKNDMSSALAVSAGQKLYFGAVTQATANTYQVYNSSGISVGTVSDGSLTLVESFGGNYGIYCYTVADGVAYVDVPEESLETYYTYILKSANDTTTEATIVNEFIQAFGIVKPSATTIAALQGKSALFVGDSITFGAKDTNSIYSYGGWAGRVGYFCDMTVKNNGISGASISTYCMNHVANCGTQHYIYNNLVKENNNTYDYIIMHGLYNDVGWGAPLGAPQGYANFDVSKADPSNFAQALELLFYTAKQQNPNAKLGFIVNFATEDGRDLSAYAQMAIQICQDWNMPYLDLYTGSSKGVLADGTVIESPDKLHPSSAGYDAFYTKIADWMAGLQ